MKRFSSRRLPRLRRKIQKATAHGPVSVAHVLAWLTAKRQNLAAQATIVPLSKLPDWTFDHKRSIVRHKRGVDHFFSVQGLLVTNAPTREVTSWNQPILVQKEGGHLAILCQEQEDMVKFLLQARYEPGNIEGMQLGPTIQATQSNLKRHHRGKKPRFSEYLEHPKVTIVYQAAHNEEGSRFWQKSNINSLILLPSSLKILLNKDDPFIWLTLPEIKTLMLYDNVVNPFVKTILAPL